MITTDVDKWRTAWWATEDVAGDIENSIFNALCGQTRLEVREILNDVRIDDFTRDVVEECFGIL